MRSDRRRHRRTGTLYCTDCGESLAPSMNYCPNCGAANGRREGKSQRTASGPETRPRTRADLARAERTNARPAGADPAVRDRLERRIADASEDGWTFERDLGDRAVMVRRTFGDVGAHLVVALVTVWWTMGLGNALYGAYRYVDGAERMVVRAERIEGDDDTVGPAESTLPRRATAAVGWILATITAALGVQLGISAVGLLLVSLAILLAAAATAALPSVSRHLEGRRSVLTNGRTRSVDERIVTAPRRPCTACTGFVGRGIERIYRDEFCVLGAALTRSEGRNYYCRDCANAASPATAATERAAATARTGARSPTGSNAAREPESDRG